jgi:hypothetical protein
MARPQKHPADATAAQRKRFAREALRARGGREITVQLEAPALAQLESLRRPGESDAGVITRVLARVQGLGF